MLQCQVNLTDAVWKITNKDGSIIEQKKNSYNEINRDNIEFFELEYPENRLFMNTVKQFKIKTNGKTLIHRLKSKGKFSVNSSSKLEPNQRIRVTALLQKNPDSSKNISHSIMNNGKTQFYEFDPELSEIYYIFEDGSIEKRNNFDSDSPYLPLVLLQSEMEHLMK